MSPALRLLDADPVPYYARHNTSNEWATPGPLFAALHREFGFTLDVCASELNHRCERYFTREQDGLAQEWTGVCWMNPPYGREIGAWICKAVASSEAGATVVCLVPSRTDTSWWHDEIIRSGAEVRFLRGRIRFNSGKGRAPFPSAVVIFRPELFLPTARPLEGSARGLPSTTPEILSVESGEHAPGGTDARTPDQCLPTFCDCTRDDRDPQRPDLHRLASAGHRPEREEAPGR